MLLQSERGTQFQIHKCKLQVIDPIYMCVHQRTIVQIELFRQKWKTHDSKKNLTTFIWK